MAAVPDWKDALREAAPVSSFPARTIIVPLEANSQSRLALSVAQVLTQTLGATLHVLPVGETRRGMRETMQALGVTSEEIRGVVLEDVSGDPAEAIMCVVARAAAPLIVMATYTGRSRFGASVGSITRAVLAKKPSAILLVPSTPGAQPWQVQRVLLAHDGTPSSDLAIAPTAELAHLVGAEVTALHIAARRARRPTEPGSLPAPLYVDQPQHEWPAWAGEFVNRMLALGHHPGVVNFKLLVAGGQPGSEVAHFARENAADLVVVPWQGRWESQRPGAVKAIVANSGCPVLLITRPEPEGASVPEG